MPDSEKLPTPSGGAALPAPRVQETEIAAKAISRALRRAANQSRAPVSIISGGGGFRARRGDRIFRLGVFASFAAFVIAPLLIASIYWGLIAANQYLTEAKFSLRSGEASLINGAPDAPSGGARDLSDGQILVNFIRSRSIVETLDKKIGLRRMFSRPDADYLSRLDATDPMEELEKYWKKRVDASIDLMTGIITVNVRAFTPEDSLLIMQNITELSETLANDLSTRSRRDALNMTKAELARAEEQLKKATLSMRDARNAEGVLNAPAAAEAINKVITQLRTELASAEESIALQRSATAVNSPIMRLSQARVQSLKKQIADYSEQIATSGAKSNESLAQHANALSSRETELALAQQRYALATAAFENARVDLETQRAYFNSFLRPTLAEKSLYPRRWLEWVIIVAPSMILWGLFAAIAFLVRDHMAK